MKRSVNRVLTTHTGSLPRPPELLPHLFAKEDGKVDAEALERAIRTAVTDVVRKQAESGVDVLNDGEMAVLTRDGYHTSTIDRQRIEKEVEEVEWDLDMIEKGGFPHYMLKEIFEQPRAVRDTTLGRVGQETGRIFLDEMDIAPADFARFRQVRIIACGTSWHAALAGPRMLAMSGPRLAMIAAR